MKRSSKEGFGPGVSDEIRSLLMNFKAGRTSLDEVLQTLADLPYLDLGWARLDTHRLHRKGYPEVVMGQGKTPDQVTEIVKALMVRSPRVLVTRASPEAGESVCRAVPSARYSEVARLITVGKPASRIAAPPVWVVSAGTSDLPVAEEAALTAEFFGLRIHRLYDVGVAGIHRLFPEIRQLREASAIIVVAGMEGALPGVLAGILPTPIIGVPTSSGYGVSFGGVAALLTMLNACASGVAVVNIDNGFGAAMFAYSIVRNMRLK